MTLSSRWKQRLCKSAICTSTPLLLIGTLVRLIGLGDHSFWFDEALEVGRALTPWPKLLFLTEGPDPPLYRLLLAGTLQVSRHEFVVRLPSVAFSILTVCLVYRWLAQLRHRRLGFITALLLTVSPASIYYAREVGQYSVALFLAALLLNAFEMIHREGSRLDWAFLWLVSMLALYTYYGLAWLLPALVIDSAWRIWRAQGWRGLVPLSLYLSASGVGIALLLILYIRPQYIWMSQVSLNRSFSEQGWWQIVNAFGRQLYPSVIRPLMLMLIPVPGHTGWLTEVLGVSLSILMLAGCILIWRRLPSLRRLLWILMSILASFYVASGFGCYHFGYRYALPVLPFLLMLVAVSIEFLLDRQIPFAGLLGGFICLVFVAFWPQTRLLADPWPDIQREEIRPVLQYLAQQADEDDTIYVYYGAIPAYRVYNMLPDHHTVYGNWIRHLPANDKVGAVLEATGAPDHLWLVFTHIWADEDTLIVEGLLSDCVGYQLTDSYWVRDAVAVRLSRVR